MQIPKHVISVWPKKLGGISDAVVKLTIGGAISIFPVKLAKGKGGLHLCLPKTDSVIKEHRFPVQFIDSKAKKQIARNIEKTYRPNKSTCREFDGDRQMYIDYFIFPKRIPFGQVATAVLEINQVIRIRGFRLAEYQDGHRTLFFPERFIKINGDYDFQRVVDFRNDWTEIITNEIWRAYDEEIARRQRKEVR
jgi:DNA-binding cell septation regulator SpoVG